ncbi:4'-phosphopantetheinyl transferase family protein [Acinetobacter pittii]|uniref:4'-phosphopantetheinyl transferase family protein n=1 Tax=Acinetobacter pittii TaxID=48296 RepID=UPI003AA80C7C
MISIFDISKRTIDFKLKLENEILLKSIYYHNLGENYPKIWLGYFDPLTVLHSDFNKFLEDSNLSTAHNKRKVEFIASRQLIKYGLNDLAYKPVNIEKGTFGEPIWPQGLNGSISHTKEWVAIIITNKAWQVGIDIERNFNCLSANLIIKNMLNTRELYKISNFSLKIRNLIVTIIFSAKETLYKSFFNHQNKNFSIKSFEFLDLTENTILMKLKSKILENLIDEKILYVNYSIFNNKVITWFIEKK